jgi:microsomal dipeptidase-like Zn-dependent dipeptidase
MLSRKRFLKNLAALAVGSASVPPRSLADGAPGLRSRPNELGIVDLHCHPSLKMYLLGKKIWRPSDARPGANALTMQTTTAELARGWVRGMLCAHYVPEGALKDQTILGKLYPTISRDLPSLREKLEYQDASNFTQVNIMMDDLEAQLHRANQEQCAVRFVVPRNYPEFKQAIEDGNIPVAHAIEGAHALGRNFPLTDIGCRHLPVEFPQAGSMHGDAAYYIRNLEALKTRGVCLIALSHFFENDLSFPVEGVAPDTKQKIDLEWTYEPDAKHACDRPLTEIGKIVVERMLDIGVIVDLTHATPKVRQGVFEINSGRSKPRPLTFTHTGSQRVFDKYTCGDGKYKNYRYYDVDPGEIHQISCCGGVIGVIPENFWLVGCNPRLDPGSGARFRNGVEYMVETMLDINDCTQTKDFDNVAIGTDFDGLADAPADLYKPSQLNVLIERLRARGVTPEQVKKITSGNAMRLLQEGWG